MMRRARAGAAGYATAAVAERIGSNGSGLGRPAVDLRALAGLVSRGVEWARQTRRAHVGAKRMRVVETVALGEKRFAAVLQVDGMQFLIGGGAGNVALLTALPPAAAQQTGCAAQAEESAAAAPADAAACRGWTL